MDKKNEELTADLKEFLKISPFAVIYINKKAVILYANNQADDFLDDKCLNWNGIIEGENYLDFISEHSFAKKALIKKNIIEILNEKKEDFKLEYCCNKKEAVFYKIKINKFKAGAIILYQNIKEEKQIEEKIDYLGYHDQLTEVFNRNYIEKKLEEYSQKDIFPVAVTMLDINGLSLINESYGYKKGDQILIEVAQNINDILSEKAILGRWSGDEFIVLLPESSESEVFKLREKIDDFCESTSDAEIPISLGIGTALKTKKTQDLHNIINRANKKMCQDKLTKARSSRNKFVKNLLNTLGTKSNETKEHALRMTSLAFSLGDRLGLIHEKLNELNLLATLHDIGKVTISEKILNKAGKLTEEEWQIIKTHPLKGAAIADSTEEFSGIAKYIRHHHERWDGKGYPDKIKGEEIPLLARIISLVDSYDVMTNDRPYKKAMTEKKAIAEIKKCSGSQFDPELAAEFVKLLEEEEE